MAVSINHHERQDAIDTHEIEFIKKGQITIPKKVREAMEIAPGQKGTMIAFGAGLMIFPHPPATPRLFDELREGLGTAAMSLDEMVAEMRRIRESSDYDSF